MLTKAIRACSREGIDVLMNKEDKKDKKAVGLGCWIERDHFLNFECYFVSHGIN